MIHDCTLDAGMTQYHYYVELPRSKGSQHDYTVRVERKEWIRENLAGGKKPLTGVYYAHHETNHSKYFFVKYEDAFIFMMHFSEKKP